MIVKENEVILIVKSANKNDAGVYNVSLANGKGQAQAGIRVNVRGWLTAVVILVY